MVDIIRIDDRLIHGQVVVGWGSVFDPKYILLLDDEVDADEFEKEAYLFGVPVEYDGRVYSLKSGADFIKDIDGGFIAVLKSPESAYKLYESGLKFKSLNIGGMHSSENKREFNHYTFVNDSDVEFLKRLHEFGVEIYIQDLPGEKKYSVNELFEKMV